MTASEDAFCLAAEDMYDADNEMCLSALEEVENENDAVDDGVGDDKTNDRGVVNQC